MELILKNIIDFYYKAFIYDVHEGTERNLGCIYKNLVREEKGRPHGAKLQNKGEWSILDLWRNFYIASEPRVC